MRRNNSGGTFGTSDGRTLETSPYPPGGVHPSTFDTVQAFGHASGDAGNEPARRALLISLQQRA